MYKKTHVVFFRFSFQATLSFSLIKQDIGRPGHSLGKIKVAHNENRKKLRRFSYYKNVANFEAFWRDKNFSKNLYFWELFVHSADLEQLNSKNN